MTNYNRVTGAYLQEVKHAYFSHSSTESPLWCPIYTRRNERSAVRTSVDSYLSRSTVFMLHQVLPVVRGRTSGVRHSQNAPRRDSRRGYEVVIHLHPVLSDTSLMPVLSEFRTTSDSRNGQDASVGFDKGEHADREERAHCDRETAIS
jgi:hypothetical protein